MWKLLIFTWIVRIRGLSVGGRIQPRRDKWTFRGRFIFAPAIVRAAPEKPNGVNAVSVFGWTLGGWVALEYDESPVGPYYEVVEMASVVAKKGFLGQWGQNLYVSKKSAAKACDDIWSLPAILTRIHFDDDTTENLTLTIRSNSFSLTGWKKTRIIQQDTTPKLRLALPVLWTPQIKALWSPLGFPFFFQKKDDAYPLSLHRLQISAAALRLRRFRIAPINIEEEKVKKNDDYIPLGFSLAADDLLIEIADNPNRDIL